jgi:drug/metabolite transporter superfamily protein YnfA
MLLSIIHHIPIYLAVDENLFQKASEWVLQQAGFVILAALVILGLQAWMNGRLMALFGGIVVAGILYLFTSDPSGGLLKQLSTAIQNIFS